MHRVRRFIGYVAPSEIIKVTSKSHENPTDHHYVVAIDDVTHKLIGCTCNWVTPITNLPTRTV